MVITGISARPVNNLVIKTSGVVIVKNNNTFLGECVMLRSTGIQVNEGQKRCIFPFVFDINYDLT